MSAPLKCAAVVVLALCGGFISENQAQAQLPTWHDIERAVRPQDLPVLFRTPQETASTFDDPQYTESRYRIGVANQTGRTIRVWCVVYDPTANAWVTNWNDNWTIKPGQRTFLCHGQHKPVVGTKFVMMAKALDGSNLQWGNKTTVHFVGNPYQTNGGTEVWYENIR